MPVRALEGQKSMISRTMHSLAYDSVHDEIVVNSPLAQAILMFRGSANGEEPPARFIQGPHTQIQGTDYDGNDKMTYDEVHGEIIIPVAGPKVLVFSRESNGDAAPIRVLAGPDTQIRGSRRGHPLVGVDPVNNLLIVGSTAVGIAAAGLCLFSIASPAGIPNRKPSSKDRIRPSAASARSKRTLRKAGLSPEPWVEVSAPGVFTTAAMLLRAGKSRFARLQA